MPGCISNLRPVSSTDSTMKGGLGSALSAALGCWRKKERSVYVLQSSILTICPKLQIYLPDLDRSWGFLCLLSGLLSLWKAGDVAMLGGEGGWLPKAAWERPCNAKELVRSGSAEKVSPVLRKCLLEAVSFLTPAPKGTKPSKQLPSCLSICLTSAFLSLSANWSFFSHPQVYPLDLITNFAIEKVVVFATSPMDSRHSWLLHHRSCLRTVGAGDEGAMSCTHSWAASLAPRRSSGQTLVSRRLSEDNRPVL